MKNASILIAFFLMLTSCNNNNTMTEPEKAYNIILIVGQSNTHYGFGLDTDLDATSSNIKQFGRFGANDMKIIDGVEPLEHHSQKNDKIGFGLTFAKLTHQYLNDGKEILIIPCGAGGTGFRGNHWNPGDDLYEDAVKRVNEVLSKYPESKLISILWHQGESDVANPDYQNDLDNFIISIRNDLQAESVPFILGGMVPYWVSQSNSRINQQAIISNTIQRHDNVGYADPQVPFLIKKNDDTIDVAHYDATGQRELAKRYFDEFVNIVTE